MTSAYRAYHVRVDQLLLSQMDPSEDSIAWNLSFKDGFGRIQRLNGQWFICKRMSEDHPLFALFKLTGFKTMLRKLVPMAGFRIKDPLEFVLYYREVGISFSEIVHFHWIGEISNRHIKAARSLHGPAYHPDRALELAFQEYLVTGYKAFLKAQPHNDHFVPDRNMDIQIIEESTGNRICIDTDFLITGMQQKMAFRGRKIFMYHTVPMPSELIRSGSRRKLRYHHWGDPLPDRKMINCPSQLVGTDRE